NNIFGSATQTNSGIVNNTTQTFGGAKTFTGNLTISAAAPNTALRAIALIDGNLASTTNDQIGLRVNPSITPTGSSSRSYSGIFGSPTTSSTNMSTSSIYGVAGSVETNGTGTFGILAALFGQNSVNSGTTADASAGLAIYNPNGTGTINTNYGIYLQNQTRGSANYGLY